jgi:hypothetical protein
VADIDSLADHLTCIAVRGWNGDYSRDPTTGEIHPNDDTEARALAELHTHLLDAMP